MAKSGIYRGSPLGPECQSVDVSNGSKAEVEQATAEFRSTPNNGHQRTRPFRNKGRHLAMTPAPVHMKPGWTGPHVAPNDHRSRYYALLNA